MHICISSLQKKMLSYHLWWSSSIFSSKKVFTNKLGHKNLWTSNVFFQSTVDAEEVKKFDSTAAEWWNTKKYDLLHRMNAVRVPLIRDGILSIARINQKFPLPLKGYHILDVGCGGGILSEALARLGATVTGIDPGPENIHIATEHASCNVAIKDRLNYVCDTIENVAISPTKFDAVVCSEVIEHVKDVPSFVRACVEATKDGGSLFFTTINQTPISFVLSIVLAEYVMSLVPKGTHDWNKFVKPEDLCRLLESSNCQVVSVEGVMYNPISGKFMWCNSNANLYALHAVK